MTGRSRRSPRSNTWRYGNAAPSVCSAPRRRERRSSLATPRTVPNSTTATKIPSTVAGERAGVSVTSLASVTRRRLRPGRCSACGRPLQPAGEGRQLVRARRGRLDPCTGCPRQVKSKPSGVSTSGAHRAALPVEQHPRSTRPPGVLRVVLVDHGPTLSAVARRHRPLCPVLHAAEHMCGV